MADDQTNQNLEKNVSFRLTPDLYALLQAFAQTQLDEQGRALTVGQAARRLVVSSISKKKASAASESES